MSVQSHLERIELDLRIRKVPLERFCAGIGIASSTWRRWRDGVNGPRHETWLAVEAAHAQLLAEHPVPAFTDEAA